MRKITAGYMIQYFDEKGNFKNQEFIEGNDVEFEDDDCNPIDEDDIDNLDELYHPFNKC